MTTYALNRRELIHAIELAIPFASSNDARPVLNRVNFVARYDQLHVAGVDGYRLIVTTLKGEYPALPDFGIDLSVVKGLIKHLKSLKTLETVLFTVQNDTRLIMEPVVCKGRYGYEKTGEMEIKNINIHRIDVEGFKIVSNVWKLPDIFSILPGAESVLIQHCVKSLARLSDAYKTMYKAQQNALKSAIAALPKSANRFSAKHDKKRLESRYMYTKVSIGDEHSYFDSHYVNVTLRAFNRSDSGTVSLMNSVYGGDHSHPYMLHIINDATQIIIMPINPEKDNSNLSEFNIIDLRL